MSKLKEYLEAAEKSLKAVLEKKAKIQKFLTFQGDEYKKCFECFEKTPALLDKNDSYSKQRSGIVLLVTALRSLEESKKENKYLTLILTEDQF